jgi:branched-chain amino acid transport system substrate-binding protein
MKDAIFSKRKVVFRGIIFLPLLLALVLADPIGIGYAAKEIKIGIVVGLTGPASPWGKHQWNTYQLLFDEINTKGGIKSMGGAKINYKIMDHQSKPDIAGSNAEKLIRDGVSLIFGAAYSDASMVASQVAQRAKIPYMSPSDGDPMIADRGFDYVFQVCLNAEQAADGTLALAQWLVKKTGKTPQNVAALGVQVASGTAAFKRWEVILPKVYNVAFKTSYPPTQQDFTGIVSKMKSLGVDLVFLASMPRDAILLTRVFKEMDFNPMAYIAHPGGHYTKDYIEALGKDADYTFVTSYFASDLKVPKLQELMTRYKNRFGLDFDASDAMAANAISVLVDSLERAGTDDPAKLRDAIKATDLNLGQYWFVVPDGCKFDDKNRNSKQRPLTFQIRDGKWITVHPENFASLEPVFPIPQWNKR